MLTLLMILKRGLFVLAEPAYYLQAFSHIVRNDRGIHVQALPKRMVFRFRYHSQKVIGSLR